MPTLFSRISAWCPCLYSGIINSKRTLLKQHVDNFTIAAADEHTANILLDLIDDKLSI
jgi:hypothetical protein